MSSLTSVKNRFISSLSEPCRRLVVSHGIPVPLPLNTILFEPGEDPRFVYFLTSGIASVVTAMSEGSSVEVGMIGNEGFSGSLHLLGPHRSFTTCTIQHTGSAIRVPFQQMRDLIRVSEEIRHRLYEFVQQQSSTLSQIAGCNRLHTAEERLSRWLLMALDRSCGEPLAFTHQFLAEMLGTRRSTITIAAGVLKRSGSISYTRGSLLIVNRTLLEPAACGCYTLLKDLNSALYEQPCRAAIEASC